MKEALKLYYRYMPKWILLYTLVKELIAALTAVYTKVMLPAAIAKCFLNQMTYNTLLSILCVNFLLVLLTTIPDYFIYTYIYPRKEINMMEEIQKSIFAKMHNVSLKYYDQQSFFDKFQLAMNNTLDTVKDAASWFNKFISLLAQIATTTVIISVVDAKIFLLMLGCLVLGVVFELIGVSSRLAYSKKTARIENIFDYCERVFYLENYATELRTSSISNRILLLFDNTMMKIIREVNMLYKKMFPIGCLYSVVPDIIMYFGILTYICYGIVVTKSLSVSELVTLLRSSLTLYQTLSALIASFSRCAEYSGRYSFYKEYMAIDEEAKQGNLKATGFAREICFQNVSKDYDTRRVINQLSLVIENGKTLAIIGPNGAGKSTLLKLLLKYYESTEGNIVIDGVNINEYESDSYRDLFFYLNQTPVVFEMTVAENILMNSCETKEERDKVWDVLQKVGLKDKIETLPYTIDTIIGKEFSKEGVQLSGGQCQRLVVARALASNRPIIILDEPSSHLDAQSEHEIFEVIKNEGKTIIYVTHNIKNTIVADKIVWMDNGSIIESGTYDEMIALGGNYSRAYNSMYNILMED